MINRQISILGNTQYLIEYIPYNKMNHVIEKNFIMLRRYSIVNEIATDNDIYFIDIDSYKKYWEDESTLIWPIINNEYKSYSSKILDYTQHSLLESLQMTSDDDTLKDFYYLYDGNKNETNSLANIKCDEIRIYAPYNRKKQNYVIDICSLINDITFHYFCKSSDKQTRFSEKEIIINNNIYSEYISFYIPNKSELFQKNSIVFKEDLNISIINKIVNTEDDYTSKEEILYEKFPLYLLLEPFYIKREIIDDEEVYKKYYSELSNNSQYNYKNTGINIILHQFDHIDETNKYVCSTGIAESVVSFIEDNQFRLSSKLEFDNDGILAITSRFIYPNADDMSLEDAYLYYNRIDDIKTYNEFKGWDDSNFLDEWDNDFLKLSDNKTGYIVEIAMDNKFENIIYNAIEATPKIQDFAFALNYIFDSWKQYPDILFARTIFIDKFLSNKIYSNDVIITKEYFKYLINDISIYRLQTLKDKQSNIMKYDNFNFIDKVNCIVNKKNTTDIGENLSVSSNKNNIIYKPIFFKVQDLQNIKIRQNVVQNIGINLGDYLTKVENFKLVINDLEFTEYARNDIFVIFNINASGIKNIVGKYDIVNQNNEYISSGNYELI